MATLGYTTIGSSTQTLGGEIWACKFTASEAGVIDDIVVYLDHQFGNDDAASVAVYADSSGSPGTLLAHATTPQTIDGAGAGGGAKWYTFSSFTEDETDGLTFAENDVLWLAVWPGFAGVINSYYNSGDTGQTKISTNYETYWTWKDPFGTVSSSFDRATSIYANYTPLASDPTLTGISSITGLSTITL